MTVKTSKILEGHEYTKPELPSTLSVNMVAQEASEKNTGGFTGGMPFFLFTQKSAKMTLLSHCFLHCLHLFIDSWAACGMNNFSKKNEISETKLSPRCECIYVCAYLWLSVM